MKSTEYRVRETGLGFVVESRQHHLNETGGIFAATRWQACGDADWHTRTTKRYWPTFDEALDFMARLSLADEMARKACEIAAKLRHKHPDWAEFCVLVTAEQATRALYQGGEGRA